MKGKKREVRKDLPEKFYRKADGTEYTVLVYTVGELKKVLEELPDDIHIHQGFEKGVHLKFEENDYNDDDGE